VEVKSEGTFGLGYADVTIKMRRPEGDIDEVHFPSIYIGTEGLSDLIIYEEDDDIIDYVSKKHVTRVKRQDVKIVLAGTLMPVQGEPLFTVRLDIEGVKNDDAGPVRSAGANGKGLPR
jgi:hypothetical protein